MYSDYYGLNARPFQLTPDPRFYFDSATHRKAMAYLGYGLAQGEGFIAITGEIGSGKTTLVGHLMATIDAARLTAIKIVSTQIEGDDMLRMTAQAMGLSSDGLEKAQILERIERFLVGQAQEGKRTLLIVDEAQNLTVSALEELRMLSNFQIEGQALLQIFLLGQPEFRARLNGSERLEQLRQRVIATHHLEPMQAEEIEPYIVHRLSLAGWTGNPQFTPQAYAEMYRHSEGVPRRLNALASRVMLYGAVEQLGTIEADDVATVIADMEGDTPTESLRRPAAVPTASQAAAAVDESLSARIALLETRLEEQETALRRVLTLLIDWAEADRQSPDLSLIRESAA
ncbi:XrtA/PEP-CTERM system-associated ATPase [Sphingomonas colocasiae]|uniref:XrtA-associated ATPase n=1 Tax=Sphingomonas colocasiae TaxID=1848973 RepID=A0ABS7PJ23_9SPHN|nr:XrtA/PEP-CTERM system-associated ATPase [Sphingomonas colocasiae]MBY8821288.1 XrtA-associated ATPase [Sphingomonas colocasiae]